KSEFAERNFQPLGYQRPERLNKIADTLAFKMEQMQDEYCIKHQHKATNADTARAVVSELYQAQIKLCDGYHINAPYAKKGRKGRLTVEELQTGFLKLACPTFWFNKLKRAAIRMKEHLAIAVGMVSIATGGYVSCERLSAFEAQRKANYEFIKNSIITNLLDEEEQTELLDIWLKSSSNPKKRRIELMTRMNGFDQIAEHNGDEGLFITLTAPSKYHAMLENGGVNPKWNGASPNQTQQYLCGVWAKIRAELNRQHIKTYGFRVAEPHHDATPHWHFLLYARPEHIRALKRVFWHYALEEDGTEKGARKHRCTFKTIDRKKGSGAAYLAKYVSKNVDGYGMDGLKSDETGNDSKLSALRALAWASTWGIRQFQQIGGASVGVWREARKLGDIVQDDEIIDILRIIADLGDWAAYTVYQGGALALRKDLKARLHYAVYGENKYKETRKKVNGITNQLNGTITETRLKEWVISRKPANWDELKQQRLFGINGQSATAEHSEAEIGGNAALGLVSVTVPVQKTNKSSDIDPRIRERIKNQLILIRGRATEYQIDDLLNGKHLPIYSNEQIGIYLRYSRGQLIEEKIPKTHFH
ncbi:replication endonuclease, partial [Muribacter muris]|uniref:replication endonuclease n=1 Tax=Muribacter muris TaxID=67855 RepID=UPI00069E16E4